jgi:hypothetical protein
VVPSVALNFSPAIFSSDNCEGADEKVALKGKTYWADERVKARRTVARLGGRDAEDR